MATGASPVPAALAAAADRAVRASIKTAVLGASVTGSLGAIGLTGLFWVISAGPAPVAPVAQQSSPVPTQDLPIPEPEQFRRNRQNFPLPPEAIARIGNPWLRHGATQQRLAYSGDGKFLATGGAGDRWLRVWDLSAERPRAHLLLEAGDVPAALALTQDGRTLRALVIAGADRDAQLREYDTYRGFETRRRLLVKGTIDTAAFNPEGTLLAAGKSSQVRVFSTASANERWRADVPAADRVEVAFAPSGDRVATIATGSGRADLFDARTGRPEITLNDPRGSLSQPAFSNNARLLAFWCSTNQRVRVWDLESRELIHSIKPNQPLCGFAFAPDAEAIIGFSSNTVAIRFPIRVGERPQGSDTAMAVSGVVSPDGSSIAVASRFGPVQILDAQGVRAIAGSGRDVLPPNTTGFSKAGDRLLVEGFQSWMEYPTNGDDLPRIYAPGSAPGEFVGAIGDRAALSADRKWMARYSAGRPKHNEYRIELLDAATGQERGRIELGQAALRPRFSPDGRTIYAITADCLIRGWEVQTGREVMRTSVPLQIAACGTPLLVSPNGKHLAAADKISAPGGPEQKTRVYDAATGKLVFFASIVRGEPHIAFSSDGQWFACIVPSDDPATGGTELCVWETATGRVRARLASPNGQPAFSPDGRSVAVNHEDAIVLFELATGRSRHEFRHHGEVEPSLTWRADGRVIAAVSAEAPIYLWDVVGDRTGDVPVWNSAHDEQRWAALCGSDSGDAFLALRQLWSHPERAIEFLKARMAASSDARLAARGCEALELIATPKAKQLLADWATGLPDFPLAREAKDSLRRLPQT
jgi:WD40 repeat protein